MISDFDSLEEFRAQSALLQMNLYGLRDHHVQEGLSGGGVHLLHAILSMEGYIGGRLGSKEFCIIYIQMLVVEVVVLS